MRRIPFTDRPMNTADAVSNLYDTTEPVTTTVIGAFLPVEVTTRPAPDRPGFTIDKFERGMSHLLDGNRDLFV